MRRLAALAVLLVLSLGAGTAPAQAPRKSFLWRVQDAHGAVVHLAGSLHVLTPDFYPLSPALEDAFAGSRVLVEEVDLDEMTDPRQALTLVARAMFTDGRTLEQAVSKDTFEDVRRRAEKARVPMPALRRMKPWMAAVALATPMLQAAGFNTDLGIDKHFFDKAKARGMEHRALESVAYQLDRFDLLPSALQEQMLKATLLDLDTQVSHVKEVASAWAMGDTATIERLLLGAMLDSPELYERLLVERNQNWIAPIETCLQQDAGCFVVVGAAHLVGPHGLPALLQKKGYSVAQQ